MLEKTLVLDVVQGDWNILNALVVSFNLRNLLALRNVAARMTPEVVKVFVLFGGSITSPVLTPTDVLSTCAVVYPNYMVAFRAENEYGDVFETAATSIEALEAGLDFVRPVNG